MEVTKSQKVKIILMLNAAVIFAIILVLSLIPSEAQYRQEEVELPVVPHLSNTDGNFAPPKTLLIPKIEVESLVEHVGITVAGNMAVPKGFDNVGWLRHGPEPGSLGNAVIAGHLDTGSGKPAVFFRLEELKAGDELFVLNENKEKLRFTVREIKLVPYENPPKEILDEIFGESKIPRLNLITCDGTWIPEKKTYSDRLIVITEFQEIISS